MGDRLETIQDLFPYDGPYSDETTKEAAAAAAALIRYLNNVTSKRGTTEFAATVNSVLSYTHSAVYGLDQLFSQLTRFIEDQAADPKLYDDRRDPAHPAAVTADEVVQNLAAARSVVMQLASHIGHASSASSHLGNDD